MGGLSIVDTINLKKFKALLEENNALQREQVKLLKEIRNASVLKVVSSAGD